MNRHHLDGELWYAVHCRPLKEWLASTSLIRQLGLKVYLPEIKCHRRGIVQHTPLFPGYLFVQADLGRVATSQINATAGVVRLVALGGAPQPLAAPTIEALRRRVDDLNLHGSLPHHGFELGSPVRLKGGPLQGLEAVFVGPTRPSERVRVLIEFLGQQRTVEVAADALELSAGPATRPPRRTRGKGRTIRYG